MTDTTAIEKLPVATRTKLRSTQILTSLPHIISELLQNSLDAGALNVDVGVDCQEWSCWVRDDGHGMSKDGMAMLGSEQGRYGTSKAYSLASLNDVATFGFRGEALASAADLSCLEISSRTSWSSQSWSIILKGGKNLYNGPSIRWRRESPGTVICIRDAFFNLPIRRLSHSSPTRTMELIRQEIETYALIFPHVSFSLENTNGGPERNASRARVMKIPKTSSSLASFRHLYGRALVEHVEQVDAVSGEMKLEGFISLEGAHSKTYQFLYINRHPVTTCDLHRILDSKFAASSFAKHALDEYGETDLPRSALRRSPRKTERKPVYVLNLSLPPGYVDNCLEPAKAAVQFQNKHGVSSFLSDVIESFLIRHGFRLQKRTKEVKQESDSADFPQKRRKISLDPNQEPRRGISTSAQIETRATPGGDLTARSLSFHTNPGNFVIDRENEVILRNSVTEEESLVDKRTSHSYPQLTQHTICGDRIDVVTQQSKPRRTVLSSRTLDAANESCDRGSPVMPNWIQDALQSNQAYALTEAKIPSLSLSATFTSNMQGRSVSNHDYHACHDTSPYLQTGDLSTASSLHRFRRENLRNAHIIDQVDRKFIACLVDEDFVNSSSTDSGVNSGNRSLVLIDQHAADERVRVERFLRELCVGFLHHTGQPCGETWQGTWLKELSPPVPLMLTRHEASRLACSDDMRRSFEHWGIQFAEMARIEYEDDDVVGEASQSPYVQVLVRSVPHVVSEKLLMGDELGELVKGFIARLETGSLALPLASSQKDTVDSEDFSWLKALRWCPRELIDLVNSKACRGAIMFNDTLTLKQCTRLVRQLSETAFPFHCAHGRPSLVPLVNVSDREERRQRSPVDWSRFEH